MAGKRARHVGEIVAIVIADDPYVAADGVERVAVTYEPLAAALSPEAAIAPGGPRVNEAWSDNLVSVTTSGKGHPESAMAGAEVVVAARLAYPRVAGMPLETRGVLAAPDPVGGGLTVWTSTQVPFAVRSGIACARHVLRRGADGDGVDRGVDQAAVGRHGLGLALQVEGHGDLDHLVQAHDDEVDVADVALDRVALQGLHDGRVDHAVHAQVDQGVHAGRPGQSVAQLAPVDRHAEGVHAVPVEDGRHLPLGPQASAGSAAGRTTGGGDEGDFGHGVASTLEC
jgi:hypothetical protein